jgi:hypothetical protein
MRLTATLAAGALVATAVTTLGLASPASAADPAAGPTLSWGVSPYLATKFASHTTSDGAGEDANGIVFGGGEGVADPVAGTFSLDYDGTVTYDYGVAGVSVTFSDPSVELHEAGDGVVTADVSWTGPSGSGTAHVPVTRFDEATWDDAALQATPDWAGVIPADSPAAAAAGIPAGKPVNGESWSPELLTALPSDVKAFFYSSGSNPASDALKAPAAFTAESTGGPAVVATTAYAAKAVTVDVSGTGFSAVTEPGDMGIYVGLAPSGGLPDTDSQEDMDKFADSEWVTPAQMPDGSWSVTLDPATSDLDFGADYSIYTWQAHTHSNPSQDTETPVDLDWSKLQTATKLKLDLAKAPTTKKGGTLAVDAGKATGKVTVALTRGKKAGLKKTATLENGRVNVALPKLAKGTWTATVAYPGGGAYKAAKKSLSFTVR